METQSQAQPYRGRFAPSPTGPLHFGSLVAAIGSYLEARTRQGEWLVRIEDLDGPRVVAGAAESILRTLEAFGMDWDGDVVYQSQRNDAYHAALHLLRQHGLTYHCACTRREVADSWINGVDGVVYPGTCRNGIAAGRQPRALRVRTDDRAIDFEDGLQGPIRQRVESEIGDFVLHRADGYIAYQLAVVVDDAEQGVTDVVRGADLLDSTPRQMYLQRLLGYPTPAYLHLPVAANAHGEKLSKQTLAAPVDETQPLNALVRVMDFLGQKPPHELLPAGLETFWQWALANWNAARLPKARSIKLE